MSTSKLVLHHE